jgi:hypothetical protein
VSACADTSVDYHHFEVSMHAKCVYTSSGGGGCQLLTPATTVADIMSSLQLPSVSDYTQIWVLSGSSQDPTDIPVGDALFQGVLSNTQDACIPMLVTAGDGFVTHADTVAQDLGMGQVYTQQTNPPGFFSVAEFKASPLTHLTGTQLSQNVLFTGVTSMVDSVTQLLGQNSVGDSLAATVPAPTVYQVIAQNTAGQPTIAVGAAQLAGDSARPFIFDSGWQRMYALGQDPGTLQYLKNIVMYLSLVGCKAAPIGMPM